MDPSSSEIARPKILFIASQRDAAIQDCAREIQQAGGVIEWSPNVYAAMAVLAKGAAFSSVVIDTRFLDQSESAFLTLAPRYFQGLDFVVPELHTNGWGAEARAEGVRRLPVSRLNECVPAIRAHPAELEIEAPPAPAATSSWADFPLDVEAVADDEPLQEPEVNPPAAIPLSTDGGSQLDEEGLSLHEAVRKRMGVNDPRMIRRRPPTARLADQGGNGGRPPANPSSVSDEELRALLDPRQFGGKSPDTPPREKP